MSFTAECCELWVVLLAVSVCSSVCLSGCTEMSFTAECCELCVVLLAVSVCLSVCLSVWVVLVHGAMTQQTTAVTDTLDL